MACVNISCNSTPKAVQFCFEKDEDFIKAFRILAYSIIMAVSLIGNSLVLGVLWQDRKMKRYMNYFIGNMAVADLIITLVYMPRMVSAVAIGYEWLVGGTLGLVLCKIVPFLHHVAILVSVLSLVALSFERFLAVATIWPRRILSERRTKVLLFLIWVVSLGVRLPHAIALTHKHGKSADYVCVASFNDLFGSLKARKLYDNFLAITFYAIPLALIIILYTLTMLKLRKRTTTLGSTRSAQQSKRTQEMNSRLCKMMLAVTIAFILCWAEYFIVRKAILKTAISCNMQFLRVFLAHTNSALTPCIYAIFSKKYRRGFSDIIRWCCCCWTRRPHNEALGELNGAHDNSGRSGVSGERVVLENIRFYSR